MKKIKIDSLIANVRELEPVLGILKNELGLKPFINRHVPIDGEMVPMALISVGAVTLEFLEYARTEALPELTSIQNIVLGLPLGQSRKIFLEPGLTMSVIPAASPCLQSVEICSRDMQADLHILQKLGSQTLNDPRCLVLGETELLFSVHPKQTEPEEVSFETLARQTGWRRFSLQGPPIRELVEFLQKNGCQKVKDVFEVIPGLQEAFLKTPSGLILQPVEQNLWKLIPASFLEKLRSNKTKEGTK